MMFARSILSNKRKTMATKYKAIFVSESCHTSIKKLAAQEKASMVLLSEVLLGLGVKQYNEQKKKVTR